MKKRNNRIKRISPDSLLGFSGSDGEGDCKQHQNLKLTLEHFNIHGPKTGAENPSFRNTMKTMKRSMQ